MGFSKSESKGLRHAFNDLRYEFYFHKLRPLYFSKHHTLPGLFEGVSLSFQACRKAFYKTVLHFFFFVGHIGLRLLVCLGLGLLSGTPALNTANDCTNGCAFACITGNCTNGNACSSPFCCAFNSTTRRSGLSRS